MTLHPGFHKILSSISTVFLTCLMISLMKYQMQAYEYLHINMMNISPSWPVDLVARTDSHVSLSQRQPIDKYHLDPLLRVFLICLLLPPTCYEGDLNVLVLMIYDICSVRCEQKTVKRAYTSACQPCGAALGVCVKCLEKKELVEK